MSGVSQFWEPDKGLLGNPIGLSSYRSTLVVFLCVLCVKFHKR